MKNILTLLMAILASFIGCAPTGPRPPIELPFAVHHAGAIVTTELRIVEKRPYIYPFDLKFYYAEKDKADQERVRKLVGGHQKDRYGKIIEPGIPIPLKLTISVIDSSGERILLEKEIFAGGMWAHGINYFIRETDSIQLPPTASRTLPRYYSELKRYS